MNDLKDDQIYLETVKFVVKTTNILNRIQACAFGTEVE